MARPTEKTPELVAKLEEAAAVGASVDEMAFYAGINRSTLYRWMAEDEELKDRLHELQQKPILAVRQNLINEASKPGNGDLALKFMERKKKDEFSPRTEHTGADGKDLGSPLTEEDKKKLEHLIYGDQPTEQPKPAEPAPAGGEPVAPATGSDNAQPPAGATEPASAPAEPAPAQEQSSGGSVSGDAGSAEVPVQ